MEKQEVIVAGGGLAGLTTAFRLSQKGVKVLLLESRAVLGGRTSSWNERGMAVESGLHRFLGFYRALPQLIKDSGLQLDNVLMWEDEVEIRSINPDKQAVFGLSALHKSIKTVATLVGNNEFISPGEKMDLVSFLSKGMYDAKNIPEELDKKDIVTYAKEQGLEDELIHTVITPLSTGLFFLPPEQYSAYVFFGLFLPALPALAKTRVGSFSGGMTEVIANPIGKTIERNGGTVQRNSTVEKVVRENGKISGVICNGELIRAQQVVLATSLTPAQNIIQESFPEEKWFSSMMELSSMPVVTFQAELREPSMSVDRSTFGPGTVFASFAEQSRTTFRHVPGRISVILANPAEYIDKSDEKIKNIVIDDAKRLDVNLEDNIQDYRIVRLPMDFYSLKPNNDQFRPTQETPVNGLTLAGDYTRQPWFGTMEGAVVSGECAAGIVLKDFAR